ncbi:MAG TPA: DMT family transporter [Bacillota bacterium]|nr:DMT family transporter [Bacillota bacterium]HOO29936.1 DMT family transporter [Bacillota bacterium]HPZ13304.1 DMT family transporter [Bacillota bacterium]
MGIFNPALAIAAGSGIAMAFQGVVNSTAAKTIGLWETTFVVLASGALLAGAGLAAGLNSGGLARLGAAPWWSLLGGPVGPLITIAVAYGIRKLGAVNATTAIIVGQIGMAAIIDHMGWFGVRPIAFSPIKILGLTLLTVGARILLS